MYECLMPYWYLIMRNFKNYITNQNKNKNNLNDHKYNKSWYLSNVYKDKKYINLYINYYVRNYPREILPASILLYYLCEYFNLKKQFET